MADRVGFEPTRACLRPYALSRGAPSAARPPVHGIRLDRHFGPNRELQYEYCTLDRYSAASSGRRPNLSLDGRGYHAQYSEFAGGRRMKIIIGHDQTSDALSHLFGLRIVHPLMEEMYDNGPILIVSCANASACSESSWSEKGD